MRSAEASANWTKLRSATPFSSRLVEIEYSGIAGLLDNKINFNSPITIVCGLNGVGKSLLLKMAWAALDWENAPEVGAAEKRLEGGKVSVKLVVNNDPVLRTLESGKLTSADLVPENVQVIYFDAPKESIAISQFFSGIIDTDEIINGVDPISLEKTDINILKYITGKAYTEVFIYEIEQFDPMRPFFVAVEHGTKYDTKTMSLGEISCFYIYWLLKSAKKGSFFFFDEPETFISPTAQAAMMDYFARVGFEKRLSILISSHSIRMMDRLSGHDLVPVFGSPEGSRVYDRAKWKLFLQSMGFSSGRRNVIFVEDRLAMSFFNELINRYDLPLFAESEVLYVGGEAPITDLCAKIPTKTKDLRVLGVYDADMALPPPNEGRWPCMALPGNASVEAMFRKLVTDAADEVAKYLGRAADDIRRVNGQWGGADDHDWLFEFGDSLGISYESLVNLLTSAWLAKDGNEDLAKRFMTEVREKLDPVIA